ncbi:MAG TPA: ATP-binding protein, partial [Candidatus Eisenbacteria bacterium]|nr:ATP-binding protein [Candidatus Eisenbacteria bacterium]
GHKLMLLNAHKVALGEGQREMFIILAFQDVTEQRHAEESLNRIAAELSFSNKELENFASTAAHDLQSPLNKIHIFAERLLGESISEKGKEYLKAMMRSSSRMGSLVENLLRVSRVTSQGHERECVSLEETVVEVLADLEIPVRESGAVVETVKLPAIMANRVQMRQLFQNLIGNAIKYGKKDEPPRISISSRLTKDSLEVFIKDNGIGFDEKYSRDIFKPFKRLHGVAEYEGSGIGLALCQKITRHHGGDITVQSRPGEGSVFTLHWPLKILAFNDRD